ncbi:hypothetical protein ACFX15_019280 [Malus domestica]
MPICNGCGGIGVPGGDDQIFSERRGVIDFLCLIASSSLGIFSAKKSEEEVTDNEQAENWFSFDIHPSHMWWELGGYEDGTLSRKSEMPKKIKRRPMT